MGILNCFPGNSVKSDLERVKAELEKVQKFQATLNKQNGDLKYTVQNQAKSIQNLQRLREKGPPRFKKRELVALSFIFPLLFVLIHDMVSVVVNFDWIRFLQVISLIFLVLMIFRMRTNRGLESVDNWNDLSEQFARRPRSASSDTLLRDGSEGASEREKETIMAVTNALRMNPPPMLPDNDVLLQVQILRFVREHGHNVDNVLKRYKASLHWR